MWLYEKFKARILQPKIHEAFNSCYNIQYIKGLHTRTREMYLHFTDQNNLVEKLVVIAPIYNTTTEMDFELPYK